MRGRSAAVAGRMTGVTGGSRSVMAERYERETPRVQARAGTGVAACARGRYIGATRTMAATAHRALSSTMRLRPLAALFLLVVGACGEHAATQYVGSVTQEAT